MRFGTFSLDVEIFKFLRSPQRTDRLVINRVGVSDQRFRQAGSFP